MKQRIKKMLTTLIVALLLITLFTTTAFASNTTTTGIGDVTATVPIEGSISVSTLPRFSRFANYLYQFLFS